MDRAEQVAFNTPPNDRTLAIGEDKVLKETHMVFLKKNSTIYVPSNLRT